MDNALLFYVNIICFSIILGILFAVGTDVQEIKRLLKKKKDEM